MSEPPPPGVPAGPAVPAAEVTGPLSPDRLATVLDDFEAWLAALSSQPGPPHDGQAQTPPAERIDLHTLLGQFLGLRHEVNLQTRAVRAQQEQNSETIEQLADALDLLRQKQEQPPMPSLEFKGF